MSEINKQLKDDEEEDSQLEALKKDHIMIYPGNVKVLVQDQEEYMIPPGMSLVDVHDKPIKLPEFDALAVGKLSLEAEKVEFHVRFTKISFIICRKQLQMLVNGKLTYTAGYRVMYFREARKLWLGKHCIQIPVYCAEIVFKKLRKIVIKLGLKWSQDKIEFMDNQYNFIQLIEEQDNIILYRNSQFLTALAKLDYFPQKQALFTGQKWINISSYLNFNDVKSKESKLDQLESLFAIDEVKFNIKYLCGYPHCHGYDATCERKVVCASNGCELTFHSECALFMNKNFNTEAINCPLHKEQTYIKLGCMPTFQNHADEYDSLVRSWPPRPPRTDLTKDLKACKLSRKQAKVLKTPLQKTRMNKAIFEPFHEKDFLAKNNIDQIEEEVKN